MPSRVGIAQIFVCGWILAAAFFSLPALAEAPGEIAPRVEAATLQPALAAELDRLGDGEEATVLLILREQADIAALRRRLDAAGASRAERHFRVVTTLRETARRAQAPLLQALSARLAQGALSGFTPRWISNLVVVRAPAATVRELARREDIARVELPPRARLIPPVGERRGGQPARGIGVTPGLRAIGADRVWRELGLTGRGILVANIDTGVDGKHPALASRWRGGHGHPASECWLDVLGGHPHSPVDEDGHGTHVMGTITGLGAATGDTIGVAWNALWIACNAIDQPVSSDFDDDIIAAFEWFADPDGDPLSVDDVPHVIQNSWGVTENFPGYGDCDDRWWAVIDHCEAAGAATTWSAGNYGPGYYTMASPADRITSPWNAFSVGAVDATSHGFPYPIAEFSSRGPSGCDGVTLKPEVVAPGVNVYSSIPQGRYAQSGWSGTSMAGPHVAGTIALMCEAAPDLTVDQLKEILFTTAIDLGRPGEDNTYGAGIIDAYAACLVALGPHGTVAGSVTNASNGGTPVPGAQIGPEEPPRSVPSAADGSYRILLPPGTYAFRVEHPSFAPDGASGVVVAEGGATALSFSLLDIGPPEIRGTTALEATDDTAGPYPVETVVTDCSDLAEVTLHYRVGGGTFQALPMAPQGGGSYAAGIPGQPLSSLVEYFVFAADVAANAASDPPGAPLDLYGFPVVPIVVHFADDVESGENGWTHAAVTPGFRDQWNRNSYDNHTPGGSWSWKCGAVQGWLWYADSLDAALASPPITIAENAELRFWHSVAAESSYAHPGWAYDGGLVEILPAGGEWQQIQ
ncbi:MAG: S8 family serine peptidase, partial [Candidatus Eisenbacteria bacterium]|nr:S8 family serine peptidase [Candidatus Eisenbacteria bacterium]